MISRYFGVKVTKKVKLCTSLGYLLSMISKLSGLPLDGRNNKISMQSICISKYTLTCFFPNKANRSLLSKFTVG